MNIYRDISKVSKNKNTVITIGTFDGFHLGHQKIIEQVISDSKRKIGRSFVITFEPHPRSVVSKDYDLKILTTIDEKVALIEKAGIENLMVINFTPEFSNLTYEDFFSNYIIDKIGISELVIGHDHKLGKGRTGDEDKLIKFGEENSFSVVPVNAIKINDEIISSTKIRHALSDGDIDKVNKYLGRYYSLSGKVVKGSRRGRSLGFPTANLNISGNKKLIPANGIYLVEVIGHGQKLYGLMNIGTRPTFEDTSEVVIEVYIYNFDKDIYNTNLTVDIISRIRDELKFSSVEELIQNMESDKEKGLEIIKKLNN